MSHITRTININSPLSKVFAYVTSPENWTKYVTSLVDVKNVSMKVPEAGTTVVCLMSVMPVCPASFVRFRTTFPGHFKAACVIVKNR